MVVVEVTNADGRSCEVSISWAGYTSSRGRTDSNGRISFDVSPGKGSIYVDGREVAKDIQISGTVKVRK